MLLMLCITKVLVEMRHLTKGGEPWMHNAARCTHSCTVLVQKSLPLTVIPTAVAGAVSGVILTGKASVYVAPPLYHHRI